MCKGEITAPLGMLALGLYFCRGRKEKPKNLREFIFEVRFEDQIIVAKA